MLFLNAAHLHAQMAGFDDYADALRSDFFLDRFRDLAGHAFLNLQPPREHIDQARDFAEAKNALLRQIGHVSLAEERKNMVFAKAEEFDVLDDDHFIVRHGKRGAVQHMVQILVIAAGQKLQRFFETLRRLAQPFAIGIFTDQLDDFSHVAGDFARVDLFVVIQQNFFRWFGHGRFPSGLSPAYSKLLFPVSSTRMRSSFALGKDFRR